MAISATAEREFPRQKKVDPITVEVVRNRLISNVTEMTETLRRAAYSPIIYEVLDFSNTIHDTAGDVVAQALGIPLFLGAMSPVVMHCLTRIPIETINPGDIIVTNDPFTAQNTHVNDIHVVVPIFYEGKIVLFCTSKAHWVDIGGKDPGSWSPDAQNIYQEGIRIPPVKLFEGGKLNQTAMDIILLNVRLPQHSMGDFRAQIAACELGVQRTVELIDKYGWETVEACIQEILAHGERMMRAEIERIPDGVYAAEDYVDSDGVVDEPVKVKMKITVKGNDMIFDLTGSDLQRGGAAGNFILAGTISSVRTAVKALLDPELPANEGCYRPITVIAPEGTCVNPLPPAPVTVADNIAIVVIELVFQCLAQVIPEKTIAGMYGGVSVLTIAGEDPRFSNRSFIHIMPYSGGWGARATKDGVNGLMTIINGDCYNVPCEIIETKFPLRVERYALMDDSGGPGKYRGGLGIAIDYRILGEKAIISTGLSRYKVPPYGLFGGRPGRGTVTVIDPDTPAEKRLYKAGGVVVKRGSLVSHWCGGGGGYGPASERDRELARNDLVKGYVSPASLKKEYGLDPDSPA